MASTNAPLAAHFRSKQRIRDSSKRDGDATTKTATGSTDAKAVAAAAAERLVFRFDFGVSDGGRSGHEATATKKKKKKKKKKKAKKPQSENDGAVTAITESAGNAEPAQVQGEKATVVGPEAVSVSSSKRVATAASGSAPPGFLKLRKPTNSDSEVMKMQLRYGRGRRNLAAIAQKKERQQQKLLQQKQQEEEEEEKEPAATTATASASTAPASNFQFNFAAERKLETS